MSDRIKELLIEAHKQTDGGIYNGHLSVWTENFAKLIVQECIDVVDKVYDEQTGMGAKLGRRQTPYQEIVNGIEEHFGVE